jgi:hypothetical protein
VGTLLWTVFHSTIFAHSIIIILVIFHMARKVVSKKEVDRADFVSERVYGVGTSRANTMNRNE